MSNWRRWIWLLFDDADGGAGAANTYITAEVALSFAVALTSQAAFGGQASVSFSPGARAVCAFGAQASHGFGLALDNPTEF